MIEISHLVKKYGGHVAVDDLSMVVEKGKIYGFLGPNGAGKSTTMNIITGYIGATSGEVRINGYDIFENPEEAKRCVGYLPELPPLYLDMTVLEYLRFAAELKKIEKSRRDQCIREVCGLTKIDEVKGRLIKNLSKGYRQRVGLAQAVLGYPEIIILDEPTVGLDPKQIIEIRDLIKELGKNHTVILSSHILSEVSAVCDHIFIISKGKLVASGTTETLQSLMAGAQELELTLRGEKAAVEETLGGIENIKEYKVTTEAGGECRAAVKAEAGFDVREPVFMAFADIRLPILEMRSSGKSLEDIFLELTGGEVSAQGDADGPTEEAPEAEAALDQGAAAACGEGAESDEGHGTADIGTEKDGQEGM